MMQRTRIRDMDSIEYNEFIKFLRQREVDCKKELIELSVASADEEVSVDLLVMHGCHILSRGRTIEIYAIMPTIEKRLVFSGSGVVEPESEILPLWQIQSTDGVSPEGDARVYFSERRDRLDGARYLSRVIIAWRTERDAIR